MVVLLGTTVERTPVSGHVFSGAGRKWNETVTTGGVRLLDPRGVRDISDVCEGLDQLSKKLMAKQPELSPRTHGLRS